MQADSPDPSGLFFTCSPHPDAFSHLCRAQTLPYKPLLQVGEEKQDSEHFHRQLGLRVKPQLLLLGTEPQATKQQIAC